MTRYARLGFTGSFGEWWLLSWLLSILSVVTLGILWPWLSYWQMRYFIDHCVIVIEPEAPPAA